MKDIPFYEDIAVLIQPIELVTFGHYLGDQLDHEFYLLSFQKDAIQRSRHVVHSTQDGMLTTTTQYSTQVHVRFWLSNPSSPENQDDVLPADLRIWVNNKLVQPPQFTNYPGSPYKRVSSKHFDITTIIAMHRSSNSITIRWTAEPQHKFFMSVNLVKKLTAKELFEKLITKPRKPATATKKQIKELLSRPVDDQEDICVPTSLQVSLNCPLGKSRMRYPCRGVNCKHLQCFDANLFLMMNELKPSFICPVCNQKLHFNDLSIDGYFMDAIQNLSNNNGEGSGNDVELLEDGSWRPFSKKVAAQSPKTQTTNSNAIIETINLDDEGDVFVLNDVHPSSPTLDFFRPFLYGKEMNSEVCRKVMRVDLPESLREPEVIEILD